MAESRIVKSILDRLNNEQNYIFLDEIFRGTNAVERIGAAIGIMQWLNNHNCLYMISTHDLNLIELAKDWNETYYFTSSFINNKFIYDYKIKSGKPQTSNAVNILKTLSYPSEVVTVAQDTIKIVNSNF